MARKGPWVPPPPKPETPAKNSLGDTLKPLILPVGKCAPSRTYTDNRTKDFSANMWDFRIILMDFTSVPGQPNSIDNSNALNAWEDANNAPSEDYLEAWEELREIIREYICRLTEKQQYVLLLWLEDKYTQKQIGDMAGICQTSVHKTIWGNRINSGLYHGGIINKLKSWAAEDPRVIKLLLRMNRGNLHQYDTEGKIGDIG